MKANALNVAYVLKRYPRLSETFILNEIRALERLGTPIHIFSLLRPEETLCHPAVSEVRARVTYFPAGWLRLAIAIARGHASMAASAPLRYVHAAWLALSWSVRSRRPWSIWKQFLRSAYVADGCRRHEIRHIHAHFANAPAIAACLASVMSGIPYSFTTHAKDLYLTRKEAIRRRVAFTRFVLTCTRYNVEYLRSFLPREDWRKVHLVYHGIDPSAFRLDALAGPAGKSADHPLILSVGRLVPKKGMRDLIAACHQLQRRRVDFRCAIVGDGPLRSDLEGLIASLGLTDTVTVLGAMAHDRLVSFYRDATVFALAPHVTENGDRDGIPNVLVEAMASGTPVVSTSISGIPELIDDERTGLLVQPKSPAVLADALERVLFDARLRSRLAASARALVQERFECWATARALEPLFTGSARG